MPAGAKAVVTCKLPSRVKRADRKACPFSRTTKTVSRATARVSFTKRFKRALPSGTVIEVTFSAPQSVGKRVRLTTRSGKGPTMSTRCLPPGGPSSGVAC